jgi:hypothetical protein
MSYTLSRHLVQQAEAKGIPLAAVYHVLNNPQITYQSFRRTPKGRVARTCAKCGSGQVKVTGVGQGHALCVPACPTCKVGVTVWVDQVETDLRDDQKEAGVTGYRGRDGRMRR